MNPQLRGLEKYAYCGFHGSRTDGDDDNDLLDPSQRQSAL